MPKKLEKCVKEVEKKQKGKKKKYNAWAVCTSSIYGKKKKK
jgi:hypothetical protein